MAFARPTLKEIITRVTADIAGRLTKAQTRRSNALVFGRTLAGVSHTLNGFTEYVAKQIFVDTADSEHLDRHASIFGITRKAASKASGSVTFSFSGDAVDVPLGTVVQSEEGAQYQVTSAPDSKSGTATVEALIAGSAGNLDAGETVTLVSPIEGVASEAAVLGIAGGADAESDEDLRSRVLSRQRETPHGGTRTDYVQWALSVPGVTRAWCYPLEDGAGTVTVRFVCDDLPDIVPTAEMVKKVQSYIDTVRPVTADVTVTAPTLKAVPIHIETLTPDTADVRAAIEAELQSLFMSESEPGSGIYLSHIRAAISAASGEVDHDLVTPTENPTAGKNELLTLGDITWS
nr:MAG TPA: Baseplate J like protein [Caudoviricetes sp.]